MTTTSFYYLPAPGEPIATTRESELLRVALALNAGTSAGQLVDELFETLGAFVPLDRIGVALLRPDGVLQSEHVRSNRPIRWGVGAEGHVEGSSLEPIVRERKIRIIEDLEAYLAARPHSPMTRLLVEEGLRSSVTLPLYTAKGALGVMFFNSRQPHAYGPQHVDLLRAVAAGIALAFERAKLIDDLRSANAALQTLDQLKTNFLSNLSHELRTPLELILGFADMLEDELEGPLNEAQHQSLGKVLSSAERLKDLLSELFEFTALESGRFDLVEVPVDLAALLRELIEEVCPAFTQQGLALEAEIPDEPLIVNGEAPRLARVFRLLLDNARKFTPPPGRVSVRAARDGDSATVSVHDTGIGIAPEHQLHVFEKFYQVEGGATRERGGTGLGLALARAIVVAHGGLLVLESKPGAGSTFTVRLPAS